VPEILKLDPQLYSLRHIRVGTGYAAALPNASTVTVLGQSTSFEELPISELLASPDLVNGTWTARLGDAGTWQIQVPNKPASDGVAWLARFSNAGKGDWVEIKRAGYLEFNGCVESITSDYQKITIGGHDGFWCLKSAYERDWQCLQAPRDVMSHASEVPVPVLVDTFQEASLAGIWTFDHTSGGSYSIGPTGLTLTITNGNGDTAEVLGGSPSAITSAQTKWSMSATVSLDNVPSNQFAFTMGLYPGGTVNVTGPSSSPLAAMGYSSWTSVGTTIPVVAFTGPVAVVVECDGQWIRAYVNGQLIGYQPAPSGPAVPYVALLCANSIGPSVASVLVTDFVFEQWQPFLMAGSDQGDYVLPGTAATYPTGGLHARYYNDVASGGLSGAAYLNTVLTPGKDNPASGQPTPYDVIEPILDTSEYPGAHVTSGFAATNWSAKFFGAVWLPLAQGNVNMQVTDGGWVGTNGVRVWIGKTQFGTQLVDQWTLTTSWSQTFTVNAAALANGSGVSESGWYPIIIEYANGTGTHGPGLYFNASGFTWTDPGGATIPNYTIPVPSTSLSPLGCIDQRYQGVSYFDMYQQTANAFGYQFACEPQQLESGLFPGNLCPRVREGHDTDELIQADLSDGVSPIINYSNVSDATDQWSSVYAIGAGISDGQGSQLQSQVFALANIAANLFDLQGWIDASDVSYQELLNARASAQLALQETPWENLTGDPRATDRLADTFPVTGNLSEFHFRPGDGVRMWLPDIGVEDDTPRQMTQVTRTFGPTGRVSSTMTPANVPENLLNTPGSNANALSNRSKTKKH
jgi:hypothetical protein